MNEETYVPTDYASAVESLEFKYANQDLKFHVPFMGDYPVQAYGEVKGMRFYFRFRHDSGSLALGIYNLKAEKFDYEKQEKFRINRLEKTKQEYDLGNITQADYEMNLLFNQKTREVLTISDDYYPNPKLIEVNINGYTGEEHEGSLTAEQAEHLFIQLMEQL